MGIGTVINYGAKFFELSEARWRQMRAFHKTATFSKFIG